MNIVRLLCAALICIPTLLVAQTYPDPGQGPEGLEFSKKVTTLEGRNKYQIDLEAFVTGQTKAVITEDIMPSDIVLVLDLSSSMQNNEVDVENKTRVNTGTTLSRDKVYKVVIDGEEYFLTMFRNWNNYNYTYYVRYKSGSAPTGRTDGYEYAPSSNSAYVVKSTDEIYSVSTQSVTRLEALKRASQQFVETVYKNSPTNTEEHHKIATVVFNREAKTYIALQDVTSSSKETMKTSLGNLTYTELSSNESYYMVTNPAIGLNQAANVLDAVKNDGRNKVVVFFTDGVPCDYGSNSFNHSWAREAVNMSYVLKQPMDATFTSYTFKDPKSGNTGSTYTSGYGAKVYSVAILDSESARIRHFLHFVSSNYPDQRVNSDYTFPNSNTGEGATGGEAPHDYYQLSNGADLSDIFNKIAHESSEGSASINLTATSTTVVDVVSESFKLPDSATDASIELYAAKCVGSSWDGVSANPKVIYKFSDDWENARTKFGATATIDKTNKTVKVTGFDFAENYVSEKLGTDGKPLSPREFTGYKLIIRFNIEIDPDSPGGAYVNTNTIRSGIYYKNDQNQDVQIATFEIPYVKIPNLVVVKKGLHKGESAIFNMSEIATDGTETLIENIIIVATCTEEGKPAVARVKIQEPGRYKVTESTWSWAYDLSSVTAEYDDEDSASITDEQWAEKGYDGVIYKKPTKFGTEANKDGRYIIRNVNDFTEDTTTYFGTVFEFTNSDEARTGDKANPAHAEAINNNEFYESVKGSASK